ncbi:MAG: sigma-70 family RNA polymerase sigma factor [Bacteroidales bacterium]|nr:sigma-70 family RNA polymerase sigma factor [Bacteroidales bacterium]
MLKKLHTEAAFTAMVRRNEALIYKVCLAFASQHGTTVDDLKQEILCKLWEGYGSFRHQCAESTWLYRVALNTALMQQRHEQHLPIIQPLGAHEEPVCEAAEESSQLEQLYALIARLEPEEQKIIYLYLDRLSGKEIAEVMEISEINVKVRLHRIKIKMKGMAQDEEQL